jgi:CIC family chloride channel protein
LPPAGYQWLHGSPAGLVALALAVGVGAGLGAIGFRYLIVGFTRLLSGHSDYSAAGHAPNPLVPWLGRWFVLLVPLAGGLVYGPLIDRFAREARGHGVPEVMAAVAERGGRIRPRVALVKSLASALCIGAGGSVGREGPIVQIGSALGSGLGQVVRVPESRLRLLVACGAAGGISATFNAPIAGVFFALELILGDFQAESFGMVVLASVTAAAIGRAAFGAHAFLSLPPFQLRSPLEYPLYGLLGVAAALVGVGFIWVLYGLEELADRAWRATRAPEWLRPAAGGLALGGLLLVLPQLYGVGYPVLEGAIAGRYLLGMLLALLLGKLVATSLTIAIGGSGGVFAPSLFMGAMLGTAYGLALGHLLPRLAGPAGAYGLVGMGATFAAAARAPITAVLIIFELTGEYSIILPLMTAIVLAAGVSRLLTGDTIYTRKLRRRGIELAHGPAASPMEHLTVAAAMRPPPDPVPATAGLAELVARFAADPERRDALPVVDEHGTLRGVASAAEVEQAVRNRSHPTAADLALVPPVLRPGQTLEEALNQLLQHHGDSLPVLDGEGRVIGWIGHRDLLRAYAAARGHLARAHPPPRPVATATTRGLPRRDADRLVSFAGELPEGPADHRQFGAGRGQV